MLWNFFGTGHGKGEHDGAGAVIKRALTAEQLDANGAKLQNAHDVVEWLTWKMADDGRQRLFVEVKMNDVDRSNAYTCQTVKGTRNTHCVLGFSRKDPTQVLLRSLSCFCSYCVDECWDQCINVRHVQPWKLHKLEPDREENNALIVEEDDIVYSEQQEELADMLEVGDHLAVLKSPTNTDNEDYYIVLCKEAKTVLSKQVKDGWGNVFNTGDAVVHGIYYAKLPQCKNSYALLRDAPTAMLHADAIVAIKFPMLRAKNKVKGYSTTYRVPLEVHERILGNVTLHNS